MRNTNLPPAIQAFKGKLYLFYTQPNTLKMSLAVSTNNGDSWQDVSIGLVYTTSAGVATTVYKDRMYVFYRDGNSGANGVFYIWTDDGSQFHEPPDRYFGFDVVGEPAAATLPGDNGIVVAGILKAEQHPTDVLDPQKSEGDHLDHPVALRTAEVTPSRKIITRIKKRALESRRGRQFS